MALRCWTSSISGSLFRKCLAFENVISYSPPTPQPKTRKFKQHAFRDNCSLGNKKPDVFHQFFQKIVVVEPCFIGRCYWKSSYQRCEPGVIRRFPFVPCLEFFDSWLESESYLGQTNRILKSFQKTTFGGIGSICQNAPIYVHICIYIYIYIFKFAFAASEAWGFGRESRASQLHRLENTIGYRTAAAGRSEWPLEPARSRKCARNRRSSPIGATGPLEMAARACFGAAGSLEIGCPSASRSCGGARNWLRERARLRWGARNSRSGPLGFAGQVENGAQACAASLEHSNWPLEPARLRWSARNVRHRC